MSKWLCIGIFFICSGLVFLQQPVAAHVLLRDTTGSTGAIVHVTPNDDPVAGQPAQLYFDIQEQLPNKEYATLRIVNQATGSEVIVPAKTSATSVAVRYTFPEQGTYTLTLTVASTQLYTFTHEQRVSRGVLGDTQPTTRYRPLASLTFIFCGSTFVALLIVAVNRRHAIFKSSTF